VQVNLLGCKKDPASDKDYRFADARAGFDARVGATTAEDMRLLDYAEIRQQIGQSCVGEFAAQSMGIRARALGQSVRYSGLGMYKLAKVQETKDFLGKDPEPDWRYVDNGTTMRAAAKAIERWGLVKEGDLKAGAWPHEERCLLRTPSRKALDGARKTRGYQYLRITGSYDERAADIGRAIRAGYPVGAAIAVDRAILDWQGPGAIGVARGELLGFHALTLCAVRSDGCFGCPSTWGKYWGNNGIGWISPIALTHDVWCLAEGIT